LLAPVLVHLRPLAVLLPIALAGAAVAGDQPTAADPAPADPPPEQAPAAAPQPEATTTPPPDGMPEGKPRGEDQDNWVDAGHAFVEQRIFAPVLRLDRFFSDERDIEAERSRSFLRWRSEVRLSQDTVGPAFTTGVRATLRLPGLNKQLRRLRLVIAGETRDALGTLFPRQPGQTGGAPGDVATDDDELGSADAGLRFQLWETLASHADLGGGVLLRLPPGVFGRVRFRWAIPVRKLFLTRTVVTGFWRTDTHFGTLTAVDLERPLGPALVARLSGSGTITEESRGVEWISEVALLAALDLRTAAQIAAAVNGVTDPLVVAQDLQTGAARRAPPVDRYRFYTRFRRDVYRRWLFVEIEPEVAWPWSLEKGRHAAWGLSLRLEVQFQGKEAPPPPPPAPPPEPADPP